MFCFVIFYYYPCIRNQKTKSYGKEKDLSVRGRSVSDSDYQS